MASKQITKCKSGVVTCFRKRNNVFCSRIQLSQRSLLQHVAADEPRASVHALSEIRKFCNRQQFHHGGHHAIQSLSLVESLNEEFEFIYPDDVVSGGVNNIIKINGVGLVPLSNISSDSDPKRNRDRYNDNDSISKNVTNKKNNREISSSSEIHRNSDVNKNNTNNSESNIDRGHQILLSDDLWKIPVGSMIVRNFLDAEKLAVWWCTSFADDDPEESIQKSILLYRRLVLEQIENPQLFEESGMSHWLSGNVPRSHLLLFRITSNWRRCWENQTSQFTPKQMLAYVDGIINISAPDPVPIGNPIYSMIMKAAIKRGNAYKAALLAEKIVDKLIQQSKDKHMINRINNHPDIITFSIAMDAWARSGKCDVAPEKAEQLLLRMRDLYNNGHMDERPNAYIYSSLMKTWLKSKREIAPHKIQEILDYMMDQSDHELLPDNPCFRAAIHAWITISKRPEKSYSILRNMVKMFEAGSSAIRLDSDFFSIVIRGYADKRDCAKAEEVFSLQQRLYSKYGTKRLNPDIKVLRSMVIAFSHSQNRGSAAKAEDMLLHMIQLAESANDTTLMPYASYFADVITAWAKSGDADAAARAEHILYKQLGLSILPSRYAIRTVMNLWVKASTDRLHPNAAERAEAILRVLQAAFDKYGNLSVKPKDDIYYYVLQAWSRQAKIATSTAPKRAKKIFLEMQEKYFLTGDKDFMTHKRHYMALLRTYVDGQHPDAANIAKDVFNKMTEQENYYRQYGSYGKDQDRDKNSDNSIWDYPLYSLLIAAFGDCGDGKNAEAVLVKMMNEYLSRQSHTLPRGSYNNSKKNSKTRKERSVLSPAPDLFVFNQVFKGWVVSHEEGIANKAEYLFQQMSSLSSSSQPSFTTAGGCGSGNNDYAKGATAAPLLPDASPNEDTYLYMTQLWLRNKDQNAPRQAEKYLRLLIKQLQQLPPSSPSLSLCYRGGSSDIHRYHFHPTPFELYTQNILAWSINGKSILRANELLEELIDLVKKSSADDSNKIRVSDISRESYTRFLKSIAMSGIPNKSNIAKALLGKKEEFDINDLERLFS